MMYEGHKHSFDSRRSLGGSILITAGHSLLSLIGFTLLTQEQHSTDNNLVFIAKKQRTNRLVEDLRELPVDNRILKKLMRT